MKDFTTKRANFNRIEFWGIISIFVFVLFFFITDGIDTDLGIENAPNRHYFEETTIGFNYYEHFFVPQLIRYIFLFASFLLLNFVVVPKLLLREGLFQNIFLIVLVFVAAGVLLGVTDTYLKGYLYSRYESRSATEVIIFRNSFLFACWLLFLFIFYSAIKYAGLYLLENAEIFQSKYKFVTKEGLAALIIWMITLFLLVIGGAEGEMILGWALIIPSGILLYWYSFYSLIPAALHKKRPFTFYFLRIALICAAAYLPLALLLLLFVRHDDAGFIFSFFNSVFQLFITAPLTWVLFKRQLKGNEEVYVLKQELGRSAASFDFLRSQINPHFLFNALNTLYGTAIQENADRTSEGIQRLGDMMRFMLQENMQEKISIAREIDYLNNYISLQRLRTDPNPNVKIESVIEEQVQIYQVAPMLLIPFVENAFKHGISFREPSHIKITLEIKDQTLYFDVYNSRHVKPDNDPEKNKSGIGLINVKQRLQLLYPNKHELIIRETGKEFFVHLTLRLS